ncbi:MAG: segregation/condensation protein A [Bacteriovoracaceae bacterium]|nr:segregation/condensation protein A [Bacteriovoracaceae bacterium]
MLNTEILVNLEDFDGPLSLLLHLIQKKEMNLDDLDLCEITQQYLNYLKLMQDYNFDVAGEFLYMATTLVYLKSQRSVEEGTDRLIDEQINEAIGGLEEIKNKEDLISKLKWLEKFQEIGQQLSKVPKLGEDIFTRPKWDKKEFHLTPTTTMTINDLTMAMVDWIRKDKRKFALMKKDRTSIKDKLVYLKDKLIVGAQIFFHDILQKSDDISDIVVTFISLLELSRLGRVSIMQNQDNGYITINTLNELSQLDIESANGFDRPSDVPAEKLDSDVDLTSAIPETTTLQ